MPEPSWHVRLASRDDLPRVGTLAADLVAAHHAFDRTRFLPETGGTADGYERFLATQLDDANVVLVVAELGGEVVGYGYAALEGHDWMSLRGPAGVIHDLFVVGERRGQAIGRALLDGVLRELTARGASQVVLSTAAANTSAQRFFARAGFRPTMIEMTR